MGEPARNWWDPHTHTAEQHHGRSRAALVYAPNMASGSYWYSCQQARRRSGCSEAISNTISDAGRPPYFHGRSNTILGTCLPLHLPFAATVRTGLPCLWPRQRLHHGLDAFDCCSQPDCNLGHLWILGLVSILLPTPGKVGQIQDEPSVPLLQPDQARRPGDDLSKLLWSCRRDSTLPSLGRQYPPSFPATL